jgi:hypothetical protein
MKINLMIDMVAWKNMANTMFKGHGMESDLAVTMAINMMIESWVQNPGTLVNPRIAGTWRFIPQKYCIMMYYVQDFDPFPDDKSLVYDGMIK